MNRFARIATLAALASTVRAAPLTAQSVDIGVQHTGISIGNSRTWNGIRLNWRDSDVRRVNGLNVTIWKPAENPDFEMNGITAGLWGPDAATINGIALGIGGVVAEHALNGVAVAGLGAVSNGDLNGIALAGLGVVTQGSMNGIALAGLGTVAQGDLRGISAAGLGLVGGGMYGINLAGLGVVGQRDMVGLNVAGLGVVGQQSMTGINVAGLGVVAERDMTGINVAGLGTVAQGNLRWINVAGLGLVANGDMQGINVAGLAVVGTGRVDGISVGGLAVVGSGGHRGIAIGGAGVVAEEAELAGAAFSLGKVDAASARGLFFGGYRIKSPDVAGIMTSIVMMRTTDMAGLSVAAYNEVRGVQRGITIGLFNTADELHGVQVGVLNHAANNSGPFRWLPLINAHF
jgi:hypothetical protein